MDVDLLVVTYAYPPMRFPRAVQIARTLSSIDERRVTVVCAADPESNDPGLLGAYPDGGRRVVRVPWPPAARGYLRVRDRVLEDKLLVPDRFRPWLRAAKRAVEERNLVGDRTVLATFGQPMSSHVLGLRLRRRHRVPWIAHFSDPWTDSSFRDGGALTRALNARLERAVFEAANTLVFTSAETVDLVFAKYPSELRRKARVLPHAHDATLYGGAQRNPDDTIVLRYLGAFYGARGPKPLFDALRLLLASDPDLATRIRVELVGSHEQPLDATATAGLPVVTRDPVPYLESLELMRTSDVLLVVDAPGTSSVFLPSKLVDYLGARRPVVALTPPGAASELVRRYGGWVADPADARACAAALASAIARSAASRNTPFGSDAVVDRYALRRVGDEFAAIVGELKR